MANQKKKSMLRALRLRKVSSATENVFEKNFIDFSLIWFKVRMILTIFNLQCGLMMIFKIIQILRTIVDLNFHGQLNSDSDDFES